VTNNDEYFQIFLLQKNRFFQNCH